MMRRNDLQQMFHSTIRIIIKTRKKTSFSLASQQSLSRPKKAPQTKQTPSNTMQHFSMNIKTSVHDDDQAFGFTRNAFLIEPALFLEKGALEDLDDATQFCLAMTEG
mmetsp:Transcript_115832/g.334517  ORF Transcript_115832/g.334517 Transcript_115832/m.334517 type:complete len:107 (+) Transcript_115832:65-385(+)